jgi:hypothetical protein
MRAGATFVNGKLVERQASQHCRKRQLSVVADGDVPEAA